MDPERLIRADKATLVPVGAEEVDALLRGDLGDRRAAPGWPHSDSAPGLGFVRSGGLAFVVLDHDGRISGECGTKSPPTADGAVEIGYGLAPASRGHGLGTSAVRALVDWLVEQPDIRSVDAEVHVSNTPSRRLVERLGFREVDSPVAGYLRYRLTVPPV
jgi:GNAT superfamily N-acetyltransferase